MMMIVGAVSRVLARAPEAKGEPHLIRILIHILIHPRPCAAAGPAAASQSRRTPCGTGSGGGPSGPGARGRTPPPWRHGIPGPRRPELPSTQPCPASLAFRSLAGTNSALSLSLSLSLCGERNETCDDSQASCLGGLRLEDPTQLKSVLSLHWNESIIINSYSWSFLPS